MNQKFWQNSEISTVSIPMQSILLWKNFPTLGFWRAVKKTKMSKLPEQDIWSIFNFHYAE